MELPQPRPFETEGRKPTHDFLSLYSHSTVQQDPRPPSSQGGYLKTHDFLQPLERAGKAGTAKEEASSIDTSASEKPPPPAPPPPPVSNQYVLPGGIGTYTISHVSHFNQRVPKPEMSPMFMVAEASSTERNTDENSSCSLYAASGFTLWEESAGKRGQTRKENVGERTNIRDTTTKMGQWPVSERPSQSSTNNHRSSFSSRSSSQAPSLKSQSFMDMIRSAKGSSQDDDLDDDDEFVIKKESSSTSQKVDLRVKVDAKSISNDQKPNTPRSKHSATEQRRRSKINDRFQMLRQLIPNSDQKRDKASFLLEVIEYIQFLQEKVNKYEGPYQGWNQEPGELMPWRNNQQPPEGSVVAPPVVFGPKLEEQNNIPISQTVLANAQSHVMDHGVDQQHMGMVNKATVPFPLSLQPNDFFSPVLAGNPVPQFPARAASEAAEPIPTSRTQLQSCPASSDVAVDSDKLKEQEELAVNGGTISISSVYSQGLLKTLTQALQNSGVDLSKASIAVQIQLGKQRSNPSTIKDNEVHRIARPRSETGDDKDKNNCDRNSKRLKTDRN